MTEDDGAKIDRERSHMVWQAALEDIDRAKRWQWLAAYGAIAAQFALIGVFAALAPRLPPLVFHGLLGGATIMTFRAGSRLLLNADYGIEHARSMKTAAAARLGLAAAELFDPAEGSVGRTREDNHWTPLLKRLLVGSMVLVLAILLLDLLHLAASALM